MFRVRRGGARPGDGRAGLQRARVEPVRAEQGKRCIPGPPRRHRGARAAEQRQHHLLARQRPRHQGVGRRRTGVHTGNGTFPFSILVLIF